MLLFFHIIFHEGLLVPLVETLEIFEAVFFALRALFLFMCLVMLLRVFHFVSDFGNVFIFEVLVEPVFNLAYGTA